MIGVGTLLLAACVPLPPEPPNVVLFLVDDLGWGDVGCYGDDFHRTPAIDGLAAGGVLFTDAYATAPVCSPSRASLMTGKSPARIRITDWIPGVRYPRAALRVPDFDQELALEERTLPEVLKERGYKTWHVGKWHLGGERFWPLEQGFDVNVAGHSKGAPGSYYFPYAKKTAATDWSVINLPPGGAQGDYLTDVLTDAAVGLIDAHVAQERAQPFFLYMSYYSVHTPIEGRPDLVEDYRARKTERPAWAARNAGYAAMVHSVDASIGRILGRLEAHDVADETVVLFTSDNGGYIGHASMGGLRAGKGFLYEGGIRVPLIARWPGVAPAGASSAEPVSGVDLFATIAALAGAEVEPHDGASLIALLRDPAAVLPERDLFWHYPHYHTPQRPPCGVVRRGRWKLIEWYEDGRLELFDLARDPGEMRDLTAREPERAAELLEALDAWRTAAGAQLTSSNPEHDPERPFAGGYTDWEAVTPGR